MPPAIRAWRPGRILRRAALAAGVVALAAGSVYALRWPAFGRAVREAAGSAIGDALGADVTVGEASGSIVTSIELRDIAVYPRPGSRLVRPGRIARLRASWPVLGGIRSVEVEAVELAFKAPEGPQRPWDEALGDALATLDRPPRLPRATLEDVRLEIGGAAIHLASCAFAPAAGGLEARLALADGSLPRWPGRSREVLLRAGVPGAALEATATGVADSGVEGLALTVGRADERGVRSVALRGVGAARAASFAGRLGPGPDARSPSALRGMLWADSLPARRLAEAVGARGVIAGAFSLECAVGADLRSRACELDATARSVAPFALDAVVLPERGRGRIAFASARAALHAEGPLDGGIADWTVHPLDATIEDAEVAGVRFDRADVSARLERGRLEIERAGMRRGKDALELAGPVDPVAGTGRLAFVFSSRDIAPYLSPFTGQVRRAGPVDLEGWLEIGAKGARLLAEAESGRGRLVVGGAPGIDIGWERLDAQVAYGEGIAAVSDVRIRGGPGGLDYSAEATAVRGAAAGEWEVASCVVRAWPGALGDGARPAGDPAAPGTLDAPDTIDAKGRVRADGTADLDVRASVALPPRWLPEGVAAFLPARGRARFEGRLEARPSVTEFRGGIVADGLQIAGRPFETARARLLLRRLAAERGGPPAFEAEARGLSLGSQALDVRLLADVVASATEDRFSVEVFPAEVVLRGDAASLPGRVSIGSLPGGAGGARLEPFELSWRGLSLSAEGETAGGRFRASLAGGTDRLERVLPPEETGLPEVAGPARVEAYLGGSREEGAGLAWAEAEALSLGGFRLGRLTASTLLEWPGEKGGLSASPSVELAGPYLAGYLRGRLPLGPSEPGARVDLRLWARAPDPAGLLPEGPARTELAKGPGGAELEFVLSGAVADPRGAGRLGFVRLPARPAAASRRATEAGPRADAPPSPARAFGQVPLAYSGGVLSVERTEIRTPWGRLEVGGELPARIQFKPYPHLASGGGPPTLAAKLAVEDFGVLGPFMPAALRSLAPQGELLVTCRVEGGFPALAPAADVVLRSGSLAPPAPVPLVEDIALEATLAGRRLEFGRAEASMGGGRIEARGAVSLDADLRSSFEVKGSDVLVIGGEETPVRARADLDLAVEADRSGAKAAGSAAVTSAVYSAEFPTGGRGRTPEDPEDALAAVGVDLALAPEGGVALPGVKGLGWLKLDVEAASAGDVRIENSLVGSRLGFRVRVRGTGEAPSVTGSVSASGGEVRVYPGVFLPVEEFRLDIPPEPGAEPGVVFRSSTLAGLARVFINAAGPLSRPSVTLFSEPPYPQEDLVMLLAFGRPPGTPTRPTRALVSPAGRVVRALVADRFPRAEPEDSALARLRLALGTEVGLPADLVPLPAPSLPDRGLVLRAEYLLTDRWSVVTEEDELGDIGMDAKYRVRWPRRPEERPPAEAAAPSPGRPRRGPPAAYELVGNRRLGSRRIGRALGPELARAAQDGWTPARLSDAAYHLRMFCRDQGFHFARVSAAAAAAGRAVFSIDEGPYVRLGEVRFRGTEAVSEKALKEALLAGMPRFVVTPFSARLAHAQADSVRAHYREEGFLAVRVGEPELEYSARERRMNVTIVADEGPRFVLGDVVFEGAGEADLPDLRALVAPDVGGPLRASLPRLLARRVRDRYREQGRPGARCEPRLVLDEGNATGRVVLAVDPGRAARVGKVKVAGNSKAATPFINRLVGLEKGQLLTGSALRAAERRLIGTNLFRSVRLLPVWPENDGALAEEAVADVEVRVEETPHLEATLSGGYGTFDGFRAGVDLGTHDAFGHGEEMHVGAELSERGVRSLGEAKFPSRSGGPHSLILTGIVESREQKSFSADYLGLAPSVSWRISPRDELRAGVRFDSVRTADVATGVPAGDVLDFENAVPFATVLSDRRDGRLNPRRGYILAAQIEGSSADWGSDVSYARVSAFASGFAPLGRDLTLALSVHGGVTAPQRGTDVLPIALRYFAGGIGSVRGIPDRGLGPMVDGAPTGGEVLLAASAELRFTVWRNVYGAVFADRGQVFATTADVDLGDTRSGYGAGIRYLTPAGFVVLDLGLNAHPRPGEPESSLYLMYGLPF